MTEKDKKDEGVRACSFNECPHCGFYFTSIVEKCNNCGLSIKALNIIRDLKAKEVSKKAELKIHYSKQIMLAMWKRVDDGIDDARSFNGDKALELRSILYDEEKDFWEDYEKYKETLLPKAEGE